MDLEEKVKFVEYKGKKILLIKMADLLENEVLQVIDYAKKIIRSQPEHSLLTLTDVTHARYNSAVVSALQEYVKENKPYVKASAVLGINPIKKIILNKIMEFSKREFLAFDNEEKAKEWLIKQ
ncbi:MAG: hypothetical protein KA120_01800 [Candidatus Goldbacteria bacterium]|nr:hypothetical protein [Candidatus Goldiibacteriota bacterium]